jgi:hypothetical protein
MAFALLLPSFVSVFLFVFLLFVMDSGLLVRHRWSIVGHNHTFEVFPVVLPFCYTRLHKNKTGLRVEGEMLSGDHPRLPLSTPSKAGTGTRMTMLVFARNNTNGGGRGRRGVDPHHSSHRVDEMSLPKKLWVIRDRVFPVYRTVSSPWIPHEGMPSREKQRLKNENARLARYGIIRTTLLAFRYRNTALSVLETLIEKEWDPVIERLPTAKLVHACRTSSLDIVIQCQKNPRADLDIHIRAIQDPACRSVWSALEEQVRA